jgi:hypothetical protein
VRGLGDYAAVFLDQTSAFGGKSTDVTEGHQQQNPIRMELLLQQRRFEYVIRAIGAAPTILLDVPVLPARAQSSLQNGAHGLFIGPGEAFDMRIAHQQHRRGTGNLRISGKAQAVRKEMRFGETFAIFAELDS